MKILLLWTDKKNFYSTKIKFLIHAFQKITDFSKKVLTLVEDTDSFLIDFRNADMYSSECIIEKYF